MVVLHRERHWRLHYGFCKFASIESERPARCYILPLMELICESYYSSTTPSLAQRALYYAIENGDERVTHGLLFEMNFENLYPGIAIPLVESHLFASRAGLSVDVALYASSINSNELGLCRNTNSARLPAWQVPKLGSGCSPIMWSIEWGSKIRTLCI